MRVGIAVAALLGFISTTTSGSTAPVTFVASSGSDANPCTRAQPCATFFGAGGVTDPAGVVNCLDSGPYGGNVLFSKSITIDCPGGIYRPNFTGISEGSGVLRVRNLTIIGNGAASGSSGILAGSGATVIIENCVIDQFTGTGVSIQQGAQVIITDTVITNNGSGSNGGGIVLSSTGSGTATVVLDRVHVENNVTGVFIAAGAGQAVRPTIKDSTISGNAFTGIFVAANGGVMTAAIENSAIVNNGGVGVYSQGTNSFVTVSRSTITGNQTGWTFASGGNLISYLNNEVSLNVAANGSPSATLAPQ
jgi:hypothetical protein